MFKQGIGKFLFAFLVFLFTSNSLWSGWTNVNSPTFHSIYSFDIDVSSNTAFFCGYAGIIYKSTDGGNSWSSKNSGTSAILNDIKMLDQNTVFCVGDDGLILKTTNGGTTWSDISSPSYTLDLNSVHIIDANTIVAVGDNALILKSTDAGSTWQSKNVALSDHLNSVIFLDNMTGFAVGNQHRILRTTDAGDTWAEITNPSINHFNHIEKVSSQILYVVGYNGTILKSTDAGAHWTTLESPTSRNILNISFINADTAYAVGSYGLLMRTVDGCNTWEIFNSGSDERLRDLFFTDSNNGMIYGERGTILSTSDGGSGTKLSVNLLSPADGEYVKIGDDLTIKWEKENFNNDMKMRILYKEGTGNWNEITKVNAWADSLSWNVNLSPSSQIFFKLEAENFAAVCDSNSSAVTVANKDLVLTSPIFGEHFLSNENINITWNHTGISLINIEYSNNNASSWSTLASNLDADLKTFQWTLPSTATNQGIIKITDASDPTNLDSNSAAFTIANLEITAPISTELVNAASTYDITWTSENISLAKIEYSIDGVNYYPIAENISSNTYTWTTPNITGSMVLKVSDQNYSHINKTVNITVTNQPGLEIITPTVSTSMPSNQIYVITWSSINVTDIKIQYSTDNGVSWNDIQSSWAASSLSYPWSVPNVPTNTGLIRIINNANDVVLDISELFEIYDGVTPSFELLAPMGGEVYNVDQVIDLNWNSKNITFFNVEYTYGTGNPWATLGSNIDASLGTNALTLPSISSSSVQLRFVETANPTNVYYTMANTFTITDPDRMVKVVHPNGSELFSKGDNLVITWEANKVSQVDIEIVVNDESVYTIATGVNSSDLSYTWTVGNMPSEKCKIRVKDSDNENISDLSDDYFTIYGLKLISPNGAEVFLFNKDQNILWESSGVSSLKIDYSTNNGSEWTNIEEDYPASASFYNWTIPNLPSKNCLVRITDWKYSAFQDSSDAVFEITGLKITNPLPYDTVVSGTNLNITWEQVNVNNLKIDFYSQETDTWTVISPKTDASLLSYTWTVPILPAGPLKIRISDYDDPGINYVMEDYFINNNNGIKILTPNGGESWDIGTSQNITWAAPKSRSVKLYYSLDKGLNWNAIDTVDATLGTYTWVLPTNSSVETLIKIEDVDLNHVTDISDSLFRISGGTYPPPSSWNFYTHTGENATIIVPTEANPRIGANSLVSDDAIGVFYRVSGEYVCGGWGLWKEENLGLNVWGDNFRTALKDGFSTNETYVFKIWDASTGIEYMAHPEYESGNAYYENNALSILENLTTHRELNINIPAYQWRLISSNLVPQDTSMEAVVAGIIDELDYMKDDDANVFFPEENVYNIDYWEMEEGYKVYTKEDATLTITGPLADPANYPINLAGASWNYISYLPETSQSIASELSSSYIYLVKNSDGEIYYPYYSINQIKNMNPGEGYKVFVTTSFSFKYGPSGPSIPIIYNPEEEIQYYYQPDHEKTGNSMIIIVEIEDNDKSLEIAAVSETGKIIGNAKIIDSSAIINVWGDRANSEEIIEGAQDNEIIKLIAYDENNEIEYELVSERITELLSSTNNLKDIKYTEDLVINTRVTLGNALQIEKEQNEINLSVYPNPASNYLYIDYDSSSIEFIQILDLEGSVLYSSKTYSGAIDLSNFISGTYFVKLIIDNNEFIKKIIIKK